MIFSSHCCPSCLMLNIIIPFFWLLNPLFSIFHLRPFFNHFLQIFLCQFDVCDPLEFMDFFLPVFFCFIPMTVHIRFFFLPCRFLPWLIYSPVPAFFRFPSTSLLLPLQSFHPALCTFCRVAFWVRMYFQSRHIFAIVSAA